MSVRTGIRIAGFPVETTETATALTVTTESTRDLVLNTNEGTNSGSITIKDGTAGDIELAPKGAVVVEDGDIELKPTTTSTAHVKTTGSLDVRCTDNLRLGTDLADSIRIGRDNSTGAKVHIRSGSDDDLVVSNGKVGIGMSDPSDALEIDGDIQLTPTASSTAHVKTTGSLDIRASGNVRMGTDGADSVRIGRDNTTVVKVHVRSGDDTDLVVSNSKVGLGTETPGTQLQLEGTAPYVTLKNSTAENTAGGCESKVIFEDHADVTLAQVEGSHSGSSNDTKGKLILSTHTGSALTAAVTIDDTQDVTFAADISVSGEVQTANIGYTDGDNAITIVDGGDCTFAADVTVTGEVIASAGIDVKNGDTGAGYINFYEDSDNGTNTCTVVGPAATADVTLTLPSATDTLVGKATTDTLTNKTLTEPKFADGGFIADAAGLELLKFDSVSSAVNEITIKSAATDDWPELQATGGDDNIPLGLTPKGTGQVLVGTGSAAGVISSTDAHDLKLQTNEGTNSGTIVITDGADGAITLTPNGTGAVAAAGAALVVGTGSAAGAVISSGNHDLSLQAGSSDTGVITITDGSNEDITIAPHGSGIIEMGSTTHLTEGMIVAIRRITDTSSDAAVSSTDHIILACRSQTIALPENSDAGTVFVVKRSDDGTSNGAITVSRSGSDTIDGANTKSLGDNHDSITVVSDGANYHMVAETLND
jgi:hypothetical protein